MSKEAKVDALTYEQAFEELEKIVGELEAEIHNLDEALRLFERGQALAKHCSQLLEKAELKVKKLGEDGDLQPME
jgi:exodeoxyribonuclease VII small subunit